MKKKRISNVIKPRGSGTLTESAFWAMIRSALRDKSRWWKPIAECRMKARRKYVGPNKRQTYEYQCSHCKKWFPMKDINVDHIIPVGTLTCAEDLPGFVERLFVEESGLQVLCNYDHDIKTQNERKNERSSLEGKTKKNKE